MKFDESLEGLFDEGESTEPDLPPSSEPPVPRPVETPAAAPVNDGLVAFDLSEDGSDAALRDIPVFYDDMNKKLRGDNIDLAARILKAMPAAVRQKRPGLTAAAGTLAVTVLHLAPHTILDGDFYKCSHDALVALSVTAPHQAVSSLLADRSASISDRMRALAAVRDAAVELAAPPTIEDVTPVITSPASIHLVGKTTRRISRAPQVLLTSSNRFSPLAETVFFYPVAEFIRDDEVFIASFAIETLGVIVESAGNSPVGLRLAKELWLALRFCKERVHAHIARAVLTAAATAFRGPPLSLYFEDCMLEIDEVRQWTESTSASCVCAACSDVRGFSSRQSCFTTPRTKWERVLQRSFC